MMKVSDCIKLFINIISTILIKKKLIDRIKMVILMKEKFNQDFLIHLFNKFLL